MNKIEALIHEQIIKELKSQGLNHIEATKAADFGLEKFKRGNLKDPYFESLCEAAQYAMAKKPKFKFKKPSKVGGKPFTYTKPQNRKHNKQNDALF